MQLEHVAAGLNIETNRETVGVGRFDLTFGHIIVFSIECKALGELDSTCRTDGVNVIFIIRRGSKVAVNQGGHDLKREPAVEFSPNKQLVGVIEPV